MKRPYADSLVRKVTDFVAAKGFATLTDVAAKFPDYTTKQIHAALSNARDRKQLKVIMRGSFRGRLQSVWAAGVQPPAEPKPAKPGPVASVWELGSPTGREWPPKFHGGRSYQLLGDWNAA